MSSSRVSACDIATVALMSHWCVPRVSRLALVAVILALAAILVFQAWATLALRAGGTPLDYALLVPRLIGLPFLFAVVWLIAKSDGHQPKQLFEVPLAIRRVLAAIAIGLLARIAEWSQITARGAFGYLESARLADQVALSFKWECPDATLMFTGALIWLFLVPVTEEFVHRGIIQNAFRHHGRFIAIASATIIFMLFHESRAYATVFVMGTILGTQYWNTKVLWYPIISHATYDGMILIDEYCLQMRWNPGIDSLPAWPAGIIATGLFTAALTAIVRLLRPE